MGRPAAKQVSRSSSSRSRSRVESVYVFLYHHRSTRQKKKTEDKRWGGGGEERSQLEGMIHFDRIGEDRRGGGAILMLFVFSHRRDDIVIDGDFAPGAIAYHLCTNSGERRWGKDLVSNSSYTHLLDHA